MCLMTASNLSASLYSESNTVVTPRQTVQFRDESQHSHFDMSRPRTILESMPQEAAKHTILSFLERPVVVGQGTWSETDNLGSNLDVITMDAVLRTTNAYHKLIGFRYLKADLEFFVQVNNQPTQQGALLMYYIPQGGVDVYQSTASAYSSAVHLPGKTGLPSKVMNLSDGVTSSCLFPFVSSRNYIDLCDSYLEDMPAMFLEVYSPLISGSVEYTILANLRNVVLACPTSDPLDPLFIPDLYSTKVASRRKPIYVAQSGDNMTVGFDPSFPMPPTEEETMKKKGVVSNIASTISSVAGTIAGLTTAVPEVALVAYPVSWVAKAVAFVADYFGWSKPVSNAVTQPIKNNPARYMANYNGIDTSHNLALDSDNQIIPFELFGVKEDEMAFDSIVTKINYMDRFEFNNTQDAGTILWGTPITPTMGRKWTEFVDTAGNGYWRISMGYLAYVASFFKYWKGDIFLQFRAIKTNFHSGRLRIVWVPADYQLDPNPEDLSLAYSTIWDLRTQSTTSIRIPYMHQYPWLKVHDAAAGYSNASYTGQQNGRLYVFVLNKLVHMSGVSPKIDIVVENAGCPGFSFAYPVDPQFVPTNIGPEGYFSNPVVPSSFDVVDSNYVAQIFDDSGISIKDQYITKFQPADDFLVSEKLSIGEKITSFRQLVKRFSAKETVLYGPEAIVDSKAVKYDLASNRSIYARKYFSDNFRYNNATFNFDTSNKPHLAFSPDLLTSIGALYSYYRGSIRHKFNLNPFYSTNLPIFYDASLAPDFGISDLADYNTVLQNRTAHVASVSTIEGMVELQTPYYSGVSHTWIKSLTVAENGDLARAPFITLLSGLNQAVNVEIPAHYIAAGDDFSFGFLSGVPLVQFTPLHAAGYLNAP